MFSSLGTGLCSHTENSAILHQDWKYHQMDITVGGSVSNKHDILT